MSYLIVLIKLRDTDLISGLLNKQISAINYFVNNYQQFVYVLCVNILNDKEAAEEITQDVLIKCIERISQFKGTSKLKTWVYTIARNETFNYIRIKRLETSGITESIANKHQIDDITSSLDQEDLNFVIHSNFNKLPFDQKEILILFYMEEMSLKEIAEATTLSESNVRVKLHRARENFKTVLSKKDITLLNQLRHG
ncbi:MAG: RNA polymerase sigma factor [Flavobacteriales bacterium]